jgi:hypothetical protein
MDMLLSLMMIADEYVVVADDDDHKLINYITGIIIGPNRPRYYM